MNWKFFQVCCCLQLMLVGLHGIVSLFAIFYSTHPFYFFLYSVAYILIMWLALFGLQIFKKLYPDEPVDGKDKKTFNRLFIINFLLTAFLFGLFFSELRSINAIRNSLGLPWSGLPFSFFIQLICYILMMIFHLLILYGLYKLRVTLYLNYRKKKFENGKKENSY